MAKFPEIRITLVELHHSEMTPGIFLTMIGLISSGLNRIMKIFLIDIEWPDSNNNC